MLPQHSCTWCGVAGHTGCIIAMSSHASGDQVSSHSSQAGGSLCRAPISRRTRRWCSSLDQAAQCCPELRGYRGSPAPPCTPPCQMTGTHRLQRVWQAQRRAAAAATRPDALVGWWGAGLSRADTASMPARRPRSHVQGQATRAGPADRHELVGTRPGRQGMACQLTWAGTDIYLLLFFSWSWSAHSHHLPQESASGLAAGAVPLFLALLLASQPCQPWSKSPLCSPSVGSDQG